MEVQTAYVAINRTNDNCGVGKVTSQNGNVYNPRKEEEAQQIDAFESALDDDFINHLPNHRKTMIYALVATLLCLPVGALALMNTYKMKEHLDCGRKSRASRHESYANNLSRAGCLAGALMWSIISLVLLVLFVIL